jgi:hypothetical protein
MAERILQDRFVRRGRGRQHQALVKWVGYTQLTWEPVSALADTAAWAFVPSPTGEEGVV